MKKESLNIQSQFLVMGLLIISIAIAVLGIIKIADFYMTSAEAQSVAEKAAAGNRDTSDMEEAIKESKLVADNLKKKNIFAPPEPKENPVKSVQGIIGDEVLIDGQNYKLGQKIGDAKIVAIEPTKVIIEWEGQRKEFAPIAAVTGPVTEPDTKPEDMQDAAEAVTASAKEEVQQEVENVAEKAPEENPFAWLGVELPNDAKEKFMNRWAGLTEEQKAKAKEEWGNMTAEQKQQAVEMWKRM